MLVFEVFSWLRRAWVAVVVGVVALVVGVAPALAPVPGFGVNSSKYLPAAGGEGTIVLEAVDLGDAPAVGGVSPITLVDRLPAGLTATSISSEQASCELGTLRCETTGTVPDFEEIRVVVGVKVAGDASGSLLNEVTVGGGGAVDAVSKEELVVGGGAAGHGVENLQLIPRNEDGTPDTQAGSHPFEMTTTVTLQGADPKDVSVDLPPGLVGDPNATPQCTGPEFGAVLKEGENSCPPETAIGVASAYLNGQRFTAPLFNLVPSKGEPARLGFEVQHVPVVLDTAVRTGHGYGVVATVSNISQIFEINSAQLTIWGVPAEPVHNAVRGWGCLYDEIIAPEEYPCSNPEKPRLVPFLTLPTVCSGPSGMFVTATEDSWLEQGDFQGAQYMPAFGMDGCNSLAFPPSVSFAAGTHAASSPAGPTFDLHESQEGLLNPGGLSASAVKKVTVTLPEGMTVNPSGANGLTACTLAQIGYEGINPSSGEFEFSPAKAQCPDSSKVATVRITTPLLANPLMGSVFVASPQNYKTGALQNPFGALIAAYIVAEDPVSGVLVKIPGVVSADSVTGRLTATFESPPLPFEDAEVKFFTGPEAALSTPSLCADSTVTSTSIAPWSGTPAVGPSAAPFELTSGPDGTPCTSQQPFAPGFEAGTTNVQAGAFAPFTVNLTRPDADQSLGKLEATLPPGLIGSLAKVTLCGEPQAQEGTCGEASLIGTTTVSAGLGTDPYVVTGKAYMTTGYGGAPYGMSIVTPPVAGPFVLQEGHPVVVRASVFVNPYTTALHIVSSEFPKIIDGIPLQIQHVNVTINRPEFTLNPTNCNKQAITGTLASSENTSSTGVSSPFQVADCSSLAFEPKLTATTSGKPSKANGASLNVKVTYPAGPADANIARFKVDLPIELPSRDSTLQKACLAAQFEANPAGCPPGSIVGHAKVLTPVLPVPLEGPAYFVSHGGEAFPSLTFVLQGYGLTIDVISTTNIKKGVTSDTIKAAPDAPFTSFEVNLPQGENSALANYGNLCTNKLKMPTAFIAQNGVETHTTTTIKPTNCPKTTKKHTKTKKQNKTKK
jgi:hypothetical protein